MHAFVSELHQIGLFMLHGKDYGVDYCLEAVAALGEETRGTVLDDVHH